ncbi:Hsp20/alpha crystallin family protein [Streptomyces sp. NPDC005525]|uniref:Hsp20/alpha crystallin family protein n=1 Tax=Streptomyces sp. NPDC005525 TaxID=3364720 RepID=UPI0036ADEA4C
MTSVDVDLRWQAFLRRFDLEHTFRLFKQTLGWTVPKVRDPHTADLWTWLIIAAHTQLRLARPLAEDLRRPWERAERRPAVKTDDVQMELSERPLGVFSRQLVLADTLDTERITADYEAGVLTLRIPIAEGAKPRKIAIGGESEHKQISS